MHTPEDPRAGSLLISRPGDCSRIYNSRLPHGIRHQGSLSHHHGRNDSIRPRIISITPWLMWWQRHGSSPAYLHTETLRRTRPLEGQSICSKPQSHSKPSTHRDSNTYMRPHIGV